MSEDKEQSRVVAEETVDCKIKLKLTDEMVMLLVASDLHVSNDDGTKESYSVALSKSGLTFVSQGGGPKGVLEIDLGDALEKALQFFKKNAEGKRG